MLNALVYHGNSDHLVILRQIDVAKPITALPNTERVIFNNTGGPGEKLTAASLRRTAQPTSETQITEEEDPDDAPVGTPVGADEEPVQDLDENAEQFATDTTPEVVAATRTDADIRSAVALIERWYRRHLSQRRLLESSELYKLMHACVKDARNITHPPERGLTHRSRFLAIIRYCLPHVLFVLSTILSKIRSNNDASKRRLSIIEPGVEMDNCQDQIATFK